MPTSPASQTNPPWYISGFFGSLGQVTELAIAGQFLSRVATYQQANPHVGLRQSIVNIQAQEGLRGFYKGFRWNVGMSVCKGFTRWSFNNLMFSVFGSRIPKEIQERHSWVLPVIVGVGGAALETTLYLCPLESMKTREMTEKWGSKTHMWRVVRTEGYSIFFRGWTGLFPRQAITWGTYLVAYDKYRALVISLREGKPARAIDKILMNFMTGATAALLTTPLDLYKTQRQKVDPIKNKNLLSSMQSLIQSYGWQGVYRSLPMRVTRSGFYAIATFTVMDFFNALPSRMKA